MILNSGCDPKVNVVFIGSEILKLLLHESLDLKHLINKTTSSLNISVDHVILSLDWLYMIKAINKHNDKIVINETK